MAGHGLQQHHKFVATETRHGVALAHGVAQTRRHHPQHLVASIVPIGIVDRLETVEINEHDAETRMGMFVLLDFVPHAFFQIITVEQAG